jgi:hypothetical protein
MYLCYSRIVQAISSNMWKKSYADSITLQFDGVHLSVWEDLEKSLYIDNLGDGVSVSLAPKITSKQYEVCEDRIYVIREKQMVSHFVMFVLDTFQKFDHRLGFDWQQRIKCTTRNGKLVKSLQNVQFRYDELNEILVLQGTTYISPYLDIIRPEPIIQPEPIHLHNTAILLFPYLKHRWDRKEQEKQTKSEPVSMNLRSKKVKVEKDFV